MSLYKTQRCRHFDEEGNPIKPYCSQGNKCRFIHPNDHQWSKLKRRIEDTPSPQNRDPARLKPKSKTQLSPARVPPRHTSPLLIPQSDLPKRRPRELHRDHDHRDWAPRRYSGSDSWGVRPHEPEFSLKRANNEDHQYPNQRQRLSEGTLYRSVSGSGSHSTRHAVQPEKVASTGPLVPERDPKTQTNVSDTFHRLAKLCCEIVQDTCFLDREQDKLKAFTGLSSELSRAVPDAAMAVTPALATVINGHTRTRERLETRVGELEALWKTLFSTLEGDISKIIDARLEQAMALLDKGRDNALRAVAHSQRLASEKLHDGTSVPRQRMDGWRETTDKTATSSQRNLVNGGAPVNAPSEEIRQERRPSLFSQAPAPEGDLGASIKIVLEDMKRQMDRQTRAMELLAKENLQLKSASERIHPQFVPTEHSSSVKKPSVL